MIMSGIRRIVFFLFSLYMGLFLSSCSPVGESSGSENPDIVREPAVAGMFYPGNPDELKGMIDLFLKETSDVSIDGKIIAIISPHAGYIYSGPVAAEGYRAVSGGDYDTIIVIGPSHYYPFNGASIYNQGPYRTPLGDVSLDMDMINDIMDRGEHIVYKPPAHTKEHSVEVQIPFLQVIFGDFELVPIVMGNQSYEMSTELARAIVESIGDKEVLIVASTDLSHYYDRSKAKEMDSLFTELLTKNDPASLYEALYSGRCEACGSGPVITTLIATGFLGYTEVTELKYDDSGWATGDTSSVVGYLSAVISGDGDKSGILPEDEKTTLTDADKEKLLFIARKTIENGLSGEMLPDFKIESEALKELTGVFVTLKKGGELRGCIGYVEPDLPLYMAVEKAAVGAAFRDPRFYPLNADELEDITIEISVLSELEQVSEKEEIEIGTHGLVITLGSNSGLLLPQVPVEQGWNREEFLENIGLKAGLFSESWKDKDAQLYKFTAEVFDEE